MHLSKEEVRDILTEIQNMVSLDQYRLSTNREKNTAWMLDYVINESGIKSILLKLTVEDFVEAVANEHPKFRHETLYIFGKNVVLNRKFEEQTDEVALYIKFNKLGNDVDKGMVVVISFHPQEFPLVYQFK